MEWSSGHELLSEKGKVEKSMYDARKVSEQATLAYCLFRTKVT